MWHRHSCLCPQPVATFNCAETRHRQECLCHIDPSISRGGRNVVLLDQNRTPIDVEAGEVATSSPAKRGADRGVVGRFFGEPGDG